MMAIAVLAVKLFQKASKSKDSLMLRFQRKRQYG
jgi:hypothetical protein